ncbi:MAG: YcgN family cysteine cluster protein [Chromatiales bacterium]
MPAKQTEPFWLSTPLEQLSREQWESLCDHCGKCCLHKLEDTDTRQIHFTNVCCRLLDHKSCECTQYTQRSTLVPDCVTLTPADLADPYWLPSTCAYRLLAEHKDLPDWHPLVSGDSNSVKRAGHSICGRVVSETEADDLEQHLISWVK